MRYVFTEYFSGLRITGIIPWEKRKCWITHAARTKGISQNMKNDPATERRCKIVVSIHTALTGHLIVVSMWNEEEAAALVVHIGETISKTVVAEKQED